VGLWGFVLLWGPPPFFPPPPPGGGGGGGGGDSGSLPPTLALPRVQAELGFAKRGGGEEEREELSGLSASSAMAMPSSERPSAVSNESASRVAMSPRTTRRSTTTSMSCLNFLSSLGASAIS